jgi:hypothetical protein
MLMRAPLFNNAVEAALQDGAAPIGSSEKSDP